MYALPPRQRRRNNYSRTLLANRTSNLLPHLSNKQLLSVKEILLNTGMVNRVIVKTITYRDLAQFPHGDISSGVVPINIPLEQPGMRLHRVEIRKDYNQQYMRSVYAACSSKSDGTGEVYVSTHYQVNNAPKDVMVQYPDSLRPYLLYTSPSLEDVVATASESSSNLYVLSSSPVSPRLQYCPILTISFLAASMPDISIPENANKVLCYLYYTN